MGLCKEREKTNFLLNPQSNFMLCEQIGFKTDYKVVISNPNG